MHVSSDRDPVEIRWRDSVLSFAGIFHCEYLLHAEGILSLRIAQLLLQVLWVWWGQFTHVASLDPKKNYPRKWEAWRAWGGYILCLFSLWVVLFDCRESRIAWELILFVTWTYFHLYDNTEIRVFSWGFPQSILLCSCVIDFSFSIICVPIDLAQID